MLPECSHISAQGRAAADRARHVFRASVRLAESAYDAARDADARLILTEWEEFAALDLPRLRSDLKFPIVIDGRNLYDPEIMAANGFTYYSVGRPTASPEPLPSPLIPPRARKSTRS